MSCTSDTVQFATIVTQDHLDYAHALAASLDRQIHCLVVDTQSQQVTLPTVRTYNLDELLNGPYRAAVAAIVAKYKTKAKKLQDGLHQHKYDCLRWALKPVFLSHLLSRHAAAVYCDCDLFFYAAPLELLELTTTNSVVLSPHWRPISPNPDAPEGYKFNWLHGIYNAGLLGVTRPGQAFLNWWCERCEESCEPRIESGFYVDQRYLDIVPIYFSDVAILRHKGYNVAAWNLGYLERRLEDGKTTIGGEQLVCVHFSPVTIQLIRRGDDPILAIHYQRFLAELGNARRALRAIGGPTCNRPSQLL